MQRKPLTSTTVVSAGYDDGSQQLEIEFHGGRIYRYSGVPRGVYDFLLRARSKGGYVSRMIDGHYAHEEITVAPPEQDLRRALLASLGEGVPDSE